MRELIPLCDFLADVVRVRSMVDRSWRVELALPEVSGDVVIKLQGTQGDRALRIVVYDEDEFQKVLKSA